jgi:hypothetical protein
MRFDCGDSMCGHLVLWGVIRGSRRAGVPTFPLGVHSRMVRAATPNGVELDIGEVGEIEVDSVESNEMVLGGFWGDIKRANGLSFGALSAHGNVVWMTLTNGVQLDISETV